MSVCVYFHYKEKYDFFQSLFGLMILYIDEVVAGEAPENRDRQCLSVSRDSKYSADIKDRIKTVTVIAAVFENDGDYFKYDSAISEIDTVNSPYTDVSIIESTIFLKLYQSSIASLRYLYFSDSQQSSASNKSIPIL